MPEPKWVDQLIEVTERLDIPGVRDQVEEIRRNRRSQRDDDPNA